MNTAEFCLRNVKHALTNRTALFFHIVFPLFMYVFIGVILLNEDEDAGGFSARAYIAVVMALFGALMAAVSTSATIVTEQRTGWDRQLALTPLRPWQLALSRGAVTTAQTVLPVAAVYIVAAFTGAHMTAGQWVLTFLACVVTALPFGFYGTVMAQLIKTDKATGIASASVAVLMFVAGAFTPLTEAALRYARFTPLYGPVQIAHYPLAEGRIVTQEASFVHPLWWAVASIVAWTAIFVGASALLDNREKGRV